MHYTKAVARRCSIKKDALKNNVCFFFNKALDRRPATLYLCMYECIYVCIYGWIPLTVKTGLCNTVF